MRKRNFFAVLGLSALTFLAWGRADALDILVGEEGGPSVARDIEEARAEEKLHDDLSGRDSYLLERYPTSKDFQNIAPEVPLPEVYVEEKTLRDNDKATMPENPSQTGS